MDVEAYVPGETYDIVVTVVQQGRSRWGFELTAIDDDEEGGIGTLTTTDGLTQLGAAGTRQYIKHKTLGTQEGVAFDSAQWSFKWQAPIEDVGPITFYAAGNATNSSGNSFGDLIYTTSLTLPEPAPAAMGLAAITALLGLARSRRRAKS